MSKMEKLMNYLSTSHGEQWYEKTEQALMLVATVLASISFQSAMNPPGGVWQADTVKGEIPESITCTRSKPCYAGTSVLADRDPDAFRCFLIFNTGSLIASLSIILLIISGFPLKNKFCMWVLTLTMCMAVVFMVLAYLVGLDMVVAGRAFPMRTFETVLYMWFGIVGTVGLIFLVRFLYWLVRKLREFMLKMRSGTKDESQTLSEEVARVHAENVSGMKLLSKLMGSGMGKFMLKMRSGTKDESRTLSEEVARVHAENVSGMKKFGEFMPKMGSGMGKLSEFMLKMLKRRCGTKKFMLKMRSGTKDESRTLSA